MDQRALHKLWLQLTDEYGPIIKIISIGVPPFVLLTNPDDCELVVHATMDNPLREALGSLKKVRYEAADNYFEKKAGLLPEYV